MEGNKKYFAFISYKREDEKWAKWLKRKLEHYHLPASLNGHDIPENLRYVFRDVENMPGGGLSKRIHDALDKSQNLIVICSPRAAANPKWINDEINYFKEKKGIEKVFPFIIEGIPHSKDKEKECFPSALEELTEKEERFGGNINEGGEDFATVKLIAGLLGITDVNYLWDEYAREQKRQRWLRRGIFSLVLLVTIAIAIYIGHLNAGLTAQNRRLTIENVKVTSREIIATLEKGELRNALIQLEPLLSMWQDDYRMEAPVFEQALRATYRYMNPDGIMRVYSIPLSDDQLVMDADSDYIYVADNFGKWSKRIVRFYLSTGEMADTIFPACVWQKGKFVDDVNCGQILYRDSCNNPFHTATKMRLYDINTHKDYAFQGVFYGGKIISDELVIADRDVEGQHISLLSCHDHTIRHLGDLELPLKSFYKATHIGDTLFFSNGDGLLSWSISQKQWIQKKGQTSRDVASTDFRSITNVSPRNKMMACVQRDKGLMLWSAANDSSLVIDNKAKNAFIAMNDDGSILAVQNLLTDSLVVYIDKRPMFATKTGSIVYSLLFATNNDLLFFDGYSVIRYQISANFHTRPLYASDGYTYITFEPQALVVGNDTIEQPLFKFTWEGHNPLNDFGLSPRGTYLWLCSDTWDFALLDYQKKKIVMGLPLPDSVRNSRNRHLYTYQMSEDESTVLRGKWTLPNQEVWFYHVDSVSHASTHIQRPENLFISSLSPDGHYVLRRIGKDVLICDTADVDQPRFTIPPVPQCSPSTFAFSSDGKRLLISYTDGSIRLWDIASKELVAPVINSEHVLTHLDISPDGQYVVGTTNRISSGRNDVFVWHSPTGQMVDRLNTDYMEILQSYYGINPNYTSFHATFARSKEAGIIVNDQAKWGFSRVYDFLSFEDLLDIFRQIYQ